MALITQLRRDVNLPAVADLATELSKVVKAQQDDLPPLTGEIAALALYAMCAAGAQTYPIATRNERLFQVALRGADAMAKIIVDVGALSDAEAGDFSRFGRTH